MRLRGIGSNPSALAAADETRTRSSSSARVVLEELLDAIQLPQHGVQFPFRRGSVPLTITKGFHLCIVVSPLTATSLASDNGECSASLSSTERLVRNFQQFPNARATDDLVSQVA